jgi:cadmium resistance protein CadD (predicted permease)
MVNHPKLGAPIRRYGKVLSPIVLIALGSLILYQAGSLGLFRH